MVRHAIWVLALAIAFPVQAQDTTCVPTRQLVKARQEIESLRAQVRRQDTLISNLKAQTRVLRQISAQDSIIHEAQTERLKTRAERLKWRKEQKQYWKAKAQRRWIVVGVAGVLGFLLAN